MVAVETSESGARIEANGEDLGKSPVTIKIFGDKDGTFHNFGSYEYVIKAYPLRPGQYVQTKRFKTGGWFTPEDNIPKRVFFDLSLAPAGGDPGPPPVSSGPRSMKATGTAFFVTPDGGLLTAYHVVEGGSTIRLKLPDGSVVPATIVQYDVQNDLAFLKTDHRPSHFLDLISAKQAKSGDHVFTFGFPVPDILGAEAKFTAGEISSLSGLLGSQSLMQVTVPIQPGNSGGPLFLEDGRVVGVVTSTAAVQRFLKSTGTLPQNVNWAVKADYALLLFDHRNENGGTVGNDKEALKKAVCLIEVE